MRFALPLPPSMSLSWTLCLLLTVFAAPCLADEWVSLADGKTFNGWKINEHPESWTIEDGAFVAHGERSHLFYVGDDKPFTNFEYKVEAMTTPGSNGGCYIMTRYQDTGWPAHGFEAQVNATQKDPKKTGSLYAVVNVMDVAPHNDNEWFEYHIIVQGNQVTMKVNGVTTVEYTQPADAQPGKDFRRVIEPGTFAFQCHDPASKIYYRNPRVKRLE